MKKTTKKKTSAKSKQPATTMSKSDFIRAQGDAPAAEIVKRGKEAGLAFTIYYVYAVRTADRSKARRNDIAQRNAAAARQQPAGDAFPAPQSSQERAEEMLMAIASEIGIGRAIELLSARRERVARVIAAA